MFEQVLDGTLMEMSESAETRYRYIIWFPYTRQAINSIQEGTMVAIPNFASMENRTHYSVLEIVSFLPMHYALQGGMDGYPGFVVEAARSATEDWVTQETESTEDTTKIQVVAMPTNLEIVEDFEKDPHIQTESNLAMVGGRVQVLNSEYANLIANHGIDPDEPNLTRIGHLVRDSQVEVLVRIEEQLRTHFGIFGFTGVGKSNLLSTQVAKLLSDTQDPVKLVFFDLMSEYTGLLVDQLMKDNTHGRILTLGRRTLPEGVFRYINHQTGSPDLDKAADLLSDYTLLPKALYGHRHKIKAALRDLLSSERILYFNEAQSVSVYDLFFNDTVVTWTKDRRGANLAKRIQVAKNALKNLGLRDYKQITFDPDLSKKVKEALEKELGQSGNAMFLEDYTGHLEKLEELESSTAEELHAAITLEEIVEDLSDPNHSSLWVLQSHHPATLRSFSKQLGEALYEFRRANGLISPLASFIFDEADEFIRQNPSGSYVDSAEIAQTLARRGRKFGIGIGIATQRIRYLDTNIMAQPHTYFVSKLPRQTDRQVVAEAFGISEEMFRQTFKFQKGQWLLMSHDATGLEAVPIPIQTPDANQRLKAWLDENYPSLV